MATAEHHEPSHEPEEVVLAFRERFWSDRQIGRERKLADYLELYPDQQELIAREFIAALDSDVGTGGSSIGLEVASGEQLGPYRIVRELGRGGQGRVYLAEDPRLGRRVALKVLTSLGFGSDDQMRRFQREAQVASRLDHPGICMVHDAGVEDGVPFIAMQYVEGETVAQRIARSRERLRLDASTYLSLDTDIVAIRGSDDVETVLERPGGSDGGRGSAALSATAGLSRDEVRATVALFEKAARALHAAHEAGILHRDIKPGNVMVTAEGQPILLDFGLARLEDDAEAPTLTRTGDLFGTPAYMSPEQITERPDRLDRRTDVYSLGATLYECLTLHRPFEAPTREALFQAILTREPLPSRRWNRGIPRDLDVVVQTAIAKEADHRYQTAGDLADELARVLALEPIKARRVSTPERVVRWARRRPLLASLVAVVLLAIPVIAALGGYVVATRDDVLAHEAARIEREREAFLEEAFRNISHGDRHVAEQSFRSALELRPGDLEATAGLALALDVLAKDREALTLVAAHPEREGALSLIYRDLLEELGHEEEARAVPEYVAESTTGWFIEGVYHGWVAHWHDVAGVAETEAMLRSAAAMERAVLATSRPRRIYHTELAHALGHLEGEYLDADRNRRLADAMAARWPDSAETWYDVGRLYGSIDVHAAEAAYRKAISLDPDHIVAHNNLGGLLLDQGRPSEAVAVLERAFERGSSNGSLAVSQQLAEALVKCGENERAVPLLEKLAANAAFDRAFPVAWVELARVHHVAGRRLPALRACNQALRFLDQLGPVSVYDVGNFLRELGRLDDAATAFLRAIELDPGYAEAHCNLAGVYADMGLPRESLEHVRKGHELGQKKKDFPYATTEWVATSESVVRTSDALDDELAALAARGGSANGDEVQRLHHALRAVFRYRDAVTLWKQLFAREPGLVDTYGFLAAAAAVRAAEQVPRAERPTLGASARAWMTAALDARIASGRGGAHAAARARADLEEVMGTTFFESVREERIAELPKEVRASWTAFWVRMEDALDELDGD